MKSFLLLLAVLSSSLIFSSCTTLENRRDTYYGYGKVMGPYTRMLHEGTSSRKTTTTVTTTATSISTTSDFKSVR